jgi:hypothetical protein
MINRKSTMAKCICEDEGVKAIRQLKLQQSWEAASHHGRIESQSKPDSADE